MSREGEVSEAASAASGITSALEAQLHYTLDDDGIWIVLGKRRENLGFWPTVADVVEAAESVGFPPMPGGFTDRAAWDAIHWRFSGGSMLDDAVIAWQRENQDRVKAAIKAEAAVSGGQFAVLAFTTDDVPSSPDSLPSQPEPVDGES